MGGGVEGAGGEGCSTSGEGGELSIESSEPPEGGGSIESLDSCSVPEAAKSF